MLDDNILQGRKVRLTAVTRSDLSIITRWYEDAAFGRLFDARPAMPKSEEQWSEWLKEQQKDKDIFLFAIRPADGDTLLGYATIDGILWPHASGWIAIGLGDRENWGRGYGGEAMTLALNFAFQELNLYRIMLTVFSYNERAIALYEKLGFTREGVLREHLQRDGRRHDMIIFGLLRREWETRRTD